MSDSDVILGMDWLSTHRAVIDCHQKKVTAYTLDITPIQFKGDRKISLSMVMKRTKWHTQLAEWLASLTLNEEAREELRLPCMVCKYEDIFPKELPRLPP